MAKLCPHCSREQGPTWDYKINYIEHRTYNQKPVMTGKGIRTVLYGDAEELTVVTYTIRECPHCHRPMVVGEDKEQIFRAKEDEEQ